MTGRLAQLSPSSSINLLCTPKHKVTLVSPTKNYRAGKKHLSLLDAMVATTAKQYARMMGQAGLNQQFPHLSSGYVNSTGDGSGKEVTWSLSCPSRYLQHALQLLQRCHEPLVLSPQLRHGVRVAPLLRLSLGWCRRLFPQQAALLLQAGDFAFQLVHLQPREETV